MNCAKDNNKKKKNIANGEMKQTYTQWEIFGNLNRTKESL